MREIVALTDIAYAINCLRTINGCNKNTMVAVPNGTQQLRTAKHPKQPKICKWSHSLSMHRMQTKMTRFLNRID